MGHSPIRIGQAAPAAPVSSAAWWPSEGLASVQAWDALISRVSKITNPDVQQEILQWIGRSDIPGSPAERYEVVVNDVTSKFTPTTDEQIASLQNRLDQLKANTSQLEAKVKNAEQAYGVFVASTEAPSMPDHDMMMECVTGGIALLGLVIMPLILD
jgi:hypothetical protein